MIKLRKITTAFLIVCACALIVFTACNSVDEPQNDLTTTTSTSQNRTEITTGASTSQHKTENTGDQTTSTKPEAEPTAANAVYPKYAQKYAYAGYTPQEAQMDPWYLTLLNVNYCLPEDHPVDIAGAGNGTYLDRRVVPAFKEMVAAAKSDGITLTPRSGWRSIDRQQENLANSINTWVGQGYSKTEATHRALTWIMLPGCSEHNAGLAMDINTFSTDDNFQDSAAFRWLMNNAMDFGFILRYPKDKTEITGVSFEPWHWRYVGVDAAREIMERGIVLEEFLER